MFVYFIFIYRSIYIYIYLVYLFVYIVFQIWYGLICRFCCGLLCASCSFQAFSMLMFGGTSLNLGTTSLVGFPVQCIPTYNICRTSQVMSETMFISSIHWSSCMFILFIYVYLYSSKSYPEFLLSLYWYNCIFYFILLHTCLFILFLYIGLYIYIYI